MGLTFQQLEIQGALEFRLWITGIARVQKTCGIDPKVLGSVALRGIADASEKPMWWGVYATGCMGEAQPQKDLFYSDFYCPAEWLIL